MTVQEALVHQGVTPVTRALIKCTVYSSNCVSKIYNLLCFEAGRPVLAVYFHAIVKASEVCIAAKDPSVAELCLKALANIAQCAAGIAAVARSMDSLFKLVHSHRGEFASVGLRK